ncbi:MAG: adenylate/guanylate cyclase domain-containing protein [Desulforhopalus sp.]
MSKILVIDSENHVYEVCREPLLKLGHELVCAESTRQAFLLAENISFDLAIVSVAKGDKSCLRGFKNIKFSNPAMAGILVTDITSLDTVLELMNNGFTRVCKKPLSEQELVTAVVDTMKFASLREDVTRLKTLLPLYELGQKFIAAQSEEKIYKELIDAVSQEAGVPSVSVMMYDEVSCSLKIVAHRGLDQEYVNSLEIKPGEKISGRVFSSEQPIILNRDSKEQHSYHSLMKRDELSAAISFPIASRGKVVGVINISETRDDIQFSEADIEMLSIITDQAMMAIENVRSTKEREKNNRVVALLEQYVSPEVSSLLVESHQDLLNVGSVEVLTVLFADIRNFTLLVQHLQPSEIREFLNSFFEFFSSHIFSGKGMLDKFMGDGALAIFGAPVRIDNPNRAAVSAACHIMGAFENLRTLWRDKSEVFEQVGLGIGISRGAVFLGNIGSARRLDYTVIGTDVNIAQRLASETASGQIFITDRVYSSELSGFSGKLQEPMMLRGMESPVEVYSIVSDSMKTGGALSS